MQLRATTAPRHLHDWQWSDAHGAFVCSCGKRIASEALDQIADGRVFVIVERTAGNYLAAEMPQPGRAGSGATPWDAVRDALR
jgi:hypothetical protein